ncbi:zinc ribbon domain-containing protein [Streptomyces sp. ISL-94]|uniref:zinc ribbon domain-containing protein n=1 Tax=Streptomyces sp. ISL-94 TaxID=2819190 RepID=UPI001BE80BD4|nr:zinc ribbon domain-containing protein [Streptomyces sp. ISL-94]MBT2477733.1 transposase [Streptomyces sp. ISL-94]
MTAPTQTAQGTGQARYTYRLRVSSTALAALDAEWARCRWVWNECVAMSRKVHGLNKGAIEKFTCGPAQLDKLLTGARRSMAWLREGASVPQQQVIRDFAKSRALAAKVSKKIARQRQDTGRKWAKKVVRDHDALAVEDFRPKFLAKSTMARKAADAAIGATKAALIEMGRKHGRTLHLVHPAHTTMDCAQCGARTKHALPLSERTYTCTACGIVSPRDKNSARVMLVRAGLNPASADLVSPATC